MENNLSIKVPCGALLNGNIVMWIAKNYFEMRKHKLRLEAFTKKKKSKQTALSFEYCFYSIYSKSAIKQNIKMLRVIHYEYLFGN